MIIRSGWRIILRQQFFCVRKSSLKTSHKCIYKKKTKTSVAHITKFVPGPICRSKTRMLMVLILLSQRFGVFLESPFGGWWVTLSVRRAVSKLHQCGSRQASGWQGSGTVTAAPDREYRLGAEDGTGAWRLQLSTSCGLASKQQDPVCVLLFTQEWKTDIDLSGHTYKRKTEGKKEGLEKWKVKLDWFICSWFYNLIHSFTQTNYSLKKNKLHLSLHTALSQTHQSLDIRSRINLRGWVKVCPWWKTEF